MTPAPPVPITLVTGALGSGKTTLVNRILSGDHGLRLAVVVNEFGDVGIDAELVTHPDDGLVEMNNGCICCQLRGDLVDALERLTARDAAIDGVVVETSGVAEPQPLLRTFIIEPDVKRRFRIDGVVTLVDARALERQLDEQPQTANQVAHADVLLLNKADTVDAAGLDRLAARLRALNPVAPIRTCSYADAEIATLFGLEAFTRTGDSADQGEMHHHDLEAVTVCFEGPLDNRRASLWLGMVLATQGDHIYRCKGVLDIAGRDDRVVFQGVYRHLDTFPGKPWGDAARTNRAVFIGRGLDRALLQDGLTGCLASRDEP